MALSRKARGRLAKLIEYMANLPASANKHFSMDAWIKHVGKDHAHFKAGEEITRAHLHRCGTAACAAGWGCTIPSFRKAGLKLVYDGTFVGNIVFGGFEAGNALVEFFDIHEDLMSELFGADHGDVSPKAWAKRARALIKYWEKENVPA